MLYLIFPLLFKILSEKAHQKNHSKKIDAATTCYQNLNGGQFNNQNFVEFFVHCHSGLPDPIFNVISTKANNVQSNNADSKVFYIQNVKCYIKTCTFQNCVFHNSMIYYDGPNNNYDAISNTITNCFNGSGISSANIMYVSSKNTNIQDNTITFTANNNACRSFYVLHNTNTFLTENEVTNSNTVSGGMGTTVYITGTSTEYSAKVTGCTFTNCGSANSLYTTYFDVPKFEFNLNTITFSTTPTDCGCITSSNRAIELSYISNLFQNSKCSNNWRSAGIDHPTESASEIVTIENNTFSGIKGENQGKCVFMQLNNANNFIFRENKLINNVNGGILIKLIFSERIEECTIDSCQFIGNEANTKWKGTFDSTNQLIVQNKLGYDCSLPFTLTL